MAALICPNHGAQPGGTTFCPECMEFLVPEETAARAQAGPVCPMPGCGNPLDADGRCPLHDIEGMVAEAAGYAGPSVSDPPSRPGGGGAATTRDAPPGTATYQLEFPFGPVPIGERELRIGRADELGSIAVSLSGYDNVSRHHALVWTRDGHLFVRDLGSTNGTYVNDRQVEESSSRQLYDGDELRLASGLRIRVRRTGAPS